MFEKYPAIAISVLEPKTILCMIWTDYRMQNMPDLALL